MEQVGSLGATLFINDSKATNAESTEKALATWPRVFTSFSAAKAKDGGIERCGPYFPRIAKAYLIGAAADTFAATLGSDVPHEACGDHGRRRRQSDPRRTLLGRAGKRRLAFAGLRLYDQYKNFEERAIISAGS